MIPRYSLPEMQRIWSNKIDIWCEIELAVLEAKSELGYINSDIVECIRESKYPTQDEVDKMENSTHHDMIAFLQVWAKHINNDNISKNIHIGLTTSDIVDSTLTMQLMYTTNRLINKFNVLINNLKAHAIEHKYTIRVGRTHGIHAELTTWGLRVINIASSMSRVLKRLIGAKEDINYIKISGAVGTYSNIDPRIEQIVAKKLGAKPFVGSTQVICRSGIAYWSNIVVIMLSLCENLVLEIRHCQRTEVGELCEGFGEKQKGSSAMPHKQNPIISERITGLSRLAKGYLFPIIDNIALWHERDISHSSVERVALVDLSLIADYVLEYTNRLISNLVVNKDRMSDNLKLTKGRIYSSIIYVYLIDYYSIDKDIAYDIVQKSAINYDNEFAESIVDYAKVRYGISIDIDKIKNIMDSKYALRHIDYIFDNLNIN